jgi:hypothetical protein
VGRPAFAAIGGWLLVTHFGAGPLGLDERAGRA